MKTKLESVHIIYKENEAIAFFKRDESSGKNIIYIASEASLDEIDQLFNQSETKIPCPTS